MVKLLNATMHEQGSFKDDFAKLGFAVEITPRLREVFGDKDAYNLAKEVVGSAKQEGFDGLLLGGRTDVMIYIAILAPIEGLQLYIAETERVRDEQDRFVFNLKGVTKVHLEHPNHAGAMICSAIDTYSLDDN